MYVCIKVIRGKYMAELSLRKFACKLLSNTVLGKKPKAPASYICRGYYYLSE